MPRGTGSEKGTYTMALIDCPECGIQVSSAAVSCPKCAYPIAEAVQDALGNTEEPKPKKKPMSTGRKLLIGFLGTLALWVVLTYGDQPQTRSPTPSTAPKPSLSRLGFLRFWRRIASRPIAVLPIASRSPV
jgi:hypothetical protein